MAYLSGEGLLGLLQPAWQTAIAGCLLIVLGAGAHRLFLRGPSRMGHAVLVTGVLILAVTLLGALTVVR